MSTAPTRPLSRTARTARVAVALAVAAWSLAVRAEPASPAPAAAAPPAAAGREAAALHACTQRADLLFVRKCVQACMIDSKTKTRVLQDSFDRETCQQRCGHQRELPSFMETCMRRAGFGAPAASRAAPSRDAPLASR
jgi:hypothetical protein